MAVRDLLEISFSYLQYFFLLISIGPSPYPAFYRAPLDILRYLNLDITILFEDDGALGGELPENWPVDVRLQFIFVSVILPLTLALTGLLSLAPKHFILWYTFLIAGIFCVALSIFALLVGDPIVNDALGGTNITILLWSGVGGIVLCIIAAIAWRFYSKSQEAARAERTYDEIMEAEVGSIDWGAVLFRVVYGAALLFFGLQLLGAFEIPAIMRKGALGIIGLAVGGLMVAIAVVLLAWTSIGFTRNGRLLQFKIGEVVKNNFLSVLLLLISILYIPAVSNVVLVINCHEVSCGAYQRFFDGGSAIEPSDDSVAQCDSCIAASGQVCPTTLCSREPVSSSRLYRDANIQCDELQQYFWPASGIMFFSYVLSMPIINYVLTSRSVRMIAQDFPLDTQEAVGLTDQEAFEEKVHASNNAAKFIYDPFQLRWKHWRMLFLFQKLATVGAAVFVVSTSDIDSAQMGLGLSTFVHLVCFSYIVVTRPFKRKIENLLIVCTQTMLLIVSGMGVAVTQSAPIPIIAWQVVAGCAGGLPLLALLIGGVLTHRDSQRKRDARERRIARAIDAIEEAEEEELEDMYGSSSDDEGGLGGTMRGLPSQANLKAPRPDRATKRVKVQSSAVPGHNAPHESAAMRRRKNKGGKKANRPSDELAMLSPASHDLSPQPRSPMHPTPRSPESRHHTLVMDDITDVVSSDGSVDGGVAAFEHSPRSRAPKRNGRTNIPSLAEHRKDDFHSAGPRSLAKGANARAPEPKKGGRRGAAVVVAPAETETPRDTSESEASPPPAARVRRKRDKMRVSSITALTGPESLTPMQRQRAQANWVRAKMRVLLQVREEMLRRDEEDEKAGKKKKGGRKQMAGWDKLVIMLMKKDASKQKNTEMQGTLARLDSNLREIGSLQAQESLTEEEMKARLRHIYEHHMERVHNTQQAVDFRINEDTTNTLHIFFMVIGMFAFVALGCCVLGVIKYGESRYFLESNPKESDIDSILAGYPTWDVFTQECCCVPLQNNTDTNVVDVEKWLCNNGRVKERIRKVTTRSGFVVSGASPPVTVTDGFAIRPMCSYAFETASGCDLSANNATGSVRLVGCGVTVSAIERNLW